MRGGARRRAGHRRLRERPAGGDRTGRARSGREINGRRDVWRSRRPLPGTPAHRRRGPEGDGTPSRPVPRVRERAGAEAAVRREPDPQRSPLRRGQEGGVRSRSGDRTAGHRSPEAARRPAGDAPVPDPSGDHRRAGARLLRREPEPLFEHPDPREPHPREGRGHRQADPGRGQGAPGEVRRARQREVDRHGKRAEGWRSRDVRPGPDGAGLREGRLRPAARSDERWGENAVRLSHHQRQRAEGRRAKAVRVGEGADQGDAPQQGAPGPDAGSLREPEARRWPQAPRGRARAHHPPGGKRSTGRRRRPLAPRARPASFDVPDRSLLTRFHRKHRGRRWGGARMDARKRGGLNGGQAVTRGRLLAITLWLATSAGAELVPGGGNTKNDCLVELDVRSGTPVPSATKGNPPVVCTDCDPRCDTGALRDGICRFQVALCVNQGNVAGCTATALGHAVAKVAGTRLAAPALDGSPACGAVTEVAVKSKRARPGKVVVSLRASSKGKPRRLDKERVVLQCKPAAPCSCAGGAPTKLSFTTDVGSGQCGHLDGDSAPAFFPLACGGLYFGGGGVIVPLPAVVPDMGQEMFNTCCSGTSLFLGPTTEATTGSKRTCSSAGCLFGPPLPLPNPAAPPISTCLVNVVAKDASGSADCSTGVTDLVDLPLDSEVFLDGDLLPTRCVGGSTPGAPCGGCASPTACPGAGAQCTNDTGRCSGGATPGAPCCSGSDCGAGTCKPGHCLAGTSVGFGCVSDTECP